MEFDIKTKTGKLACPHCGHIEFERIESIRVDIVQMAQVTDEKGKSIVDEVIDCGENEYDYKCRGCDQHVTEWELVEAKKDE